MGDVRLTLNVLSSYRLVLRKRKIVFYIIDVFLNLANSFFYFLPRDVVVVVELPQTPEDDLRSARAVRGRRTS